MCQLLHSSHCSHQLCISLLAQNNIGYLCGRIPPVCGIAVNNTGVVYLHAATEEDSELIEMQRTSRFASEHESE